MIKRLKTVILILTIKQLRKILEALYQTEKSKDKELQEIIKHLQGTLYNYTGSWWV